MQKTVTKKWGFAVVFLVVVGVLPYVANLMVEKISPRKAVVTGIRFFKKACHKTQKRVACKLKPGCVWDKNAPDKTRCSAVECDKTSVSVPVQLTRQTEHL